MITAKLIGFKELVRDLKQLPVKIQKQVLRAALRKGAQSVVQTAKATTAFEDDSGDLRKSIKALTSRDAPGEIRVRVEVQEWYGRLVEQGFTAKTHTGFEAVVFGNAASKRRWESRYRFKGAGTAIRKKYKIGKHVGARPFLVPALAENREPILANTRTELARLIAKKLGIKK